MKVYSIEWHEQCLKDSKANLEREKQELANLQNRVNRWIDDVTFYEKQIAEAKRQHKESFDRERFLRSAKIIKEVSQ